MRDNFPFAEDQDLTGVTSGGTISENIWDLEQDDSDNVMETDAQLVGWVNVVFRAGNAGATEGLWIDVISDDAVGLDSADTQIVLGSLYLNDVQLTAAAGKTYTIGVSMAGLQRYVGLLFRADSTSLAGTATPVDAAWNVNPEALAVTQKKPS